MKGFTFFILIFSFELFNVYATNSVEYQDTVKVQVILDKIPLPGASFYLKDTILILGITDKNGNATLKIPNDRNFVCVDIIGPYIELKIIRPVDFISFDLNTKRATYYFKNKKIKTKKQIITGY